MYSTWVLARVKEIVRIGYIQYRYDHFCISDNFVV